MQVDDRIKKEFNSFGYEDAKLGRKLSDADYFILYEARRYLQTHCEDINAFSKIKSTKKIVSIGSKVIKLWKNIKSNQDNSGEVEEAVNKLNNEIADIEKDINAIKRLINNDLDDEIESIFGILLYHYETGYLTYKYEREKDQNSLPGGINLSAITRDIIDQYSQNKGFGKDQLD